VRGLTETNNNIIFVLHIASIPQFSCCRGGCAKLTGEDWGGLLDSSEFGVKDPGPEPGGGLPGPSSRLTGLVWGGPILGSSRGREGRVIQEERVVTGGRLGATGTGATCDMKGPCGTGFCSEDTRFDTVTGTIPGLLWLVSCKLATGTVGRLAERGRDRLLQPRPDTWYDWYVVTGT